MTKTSKMTSHCRGNFIVFLANTEITVAKSLSSVYSLQSYNTKPGAECRYNNKENDGKNLQKIDCTDTDRHNSCMMKNV